MPILSTTFFLVWITSKYKQVFELNRKIFGQWWNFLCNYFHLKWYRKQYPAGRLALHDPYASSPASHIGLYPFKQEIEYCQPKKNQTEHLFIYGTNTTDNASLVVQLVRKPHKPPTRSPSTTISTIDTIQPPLDDVSIRFQLNDGKGNFYTLVEQVRGQPFCQTEYRCGGFAYESLHANRVGRIKFRGYLHRNGDPNRLYYVKIRLLCLYATQLYDQQRMFDDKFFAHEISTPAAAAIDGESDGSNVTPIVHSVANVETILENTMEQYCHIKGTIMVEQVMSEEAVIHFLGTIGRRFLPPMMQSPRCVTKMCGFTRKGLGFQLGVIRSGPFSYRYGATSYQADAFRMLQNCSANKCELMSGLIDIVRNSSSSGRDDPFDGKGGNSGEVVLMKFDAKFQNEPNEYKFELLPLGGNGNDDDQQSLPPLVIGSGDDNNDDLVDGGLAIQMVKVKVNNVEGLAFITTATYVEVEQSSLSKSSKLEEEKRIWRHQERVRQSLVVSLADPLAPLVELTGGKGASLSQLYHLSQKSIDSSITTTTKQPDFVVPSAVVVTCSAYNLQIESMGEEFGKKFDELEKIVLQQSLSQVSVDERKVIENKCAAFMQWFGEQKLHPEVFEDIQYKMWKVWQQHDLEHKRFAVRSSAAMEDSAEMSAAGQMTTYLGIRGDVHSLARAVMHCWASQFAFIPIEYKRGYGQPLNSPMAVVIQEMVACDAAGVIFTADPVTGDERRLTVTANFGLGESVVSATADPDSFELKVDISANSYTVPRAICGISSRRLGKKSLITRMKSEGDGDDNKNVVKNENDDRSSLNSGVHEETLENGAEKQCITDEQVCHLGEIALKIAQHYGNARDIEWGIIVNGGSGGNGQHQLYIFQSRPITALDSGFTQYELIHEMDTPHVTEHALYARSHWGENFPGSTSWQGATMFINGGFFSRMSIQQGQLKRTEYNPYYASMGYVCNQLMFNMSNTSSPFVMMFKDYPHKEEAVANVYAFFGRHITDPDVLASMKESNELLEKRADWKMKLLFPIMMKFMLFFGLRKLSHIRRLVFEQNYADILTPVISVPFGVEKFDTMYRVIVETGESMQLHGASSFGSTLKLLYLKRVLRAGVRDCSELETDINLIISHCNNVVSAEVPNMLREIATALVEEPHYDAFMATTDEQEALRLLRDTPNSKAAVLFENFLHHHGHRGYREFDPLHATWGMNPLPCVQVIKSLLGGGKDKLKPREIKSIDQLLNELHTPIGALKRAAIKYWFLPWVQDAVGYREQTKSIMIKMHDNIRKAMRSIATDMVTRGLLPELDLFFYLKNNEIYQLLAGDRDPMLVMKAKQRKRLYPVMNGYKFDEFLKGFHMQPRNLKPANDEKIDAEVTLHGTPVTVGTIIARVCVCESIEDAAAIQQGDILITYSTDIGWSPYFPLLSGIVTEIGGTISHGAVIAREFGILCLIAVTDACQYFKTGDLARLDTTTGTLVKIKQKDEDHEGNVGGGGNDEKKE